LDGPRRPRALGSVVSIPGCAAGSAEAGGGPGRVTGPRARLDLNQGPPRWRLIADCEARLANQCDACVRRVSMSRNRRMYILSEPSDSGRNLPAHFDGDCT
jgi:hypothetical protein